MEQREIMMNYKRSPQRLRAVRDPEGVYAGDIIERPR